MNISTNHKGLQRWPGIKAKQNQNPNTVSFPQNPSADTYSLGKPLAKTYKVCGHGYAAKQNLIAFGRWQKIPTLRPPAHKALARHL